MVRTRLFALLLCVSCASKSTRSDPPGIESGRTVRSLDSQPRTARLSSPLPSGKAEAFFALDTGQDQMTSRPKDAGLVVVVRYASTELRQTVATCGDPALGSALGGGTDTILEVAGCDGEVRLISSPGQVTVDRIGKDDASTTIARIPLPKSDMRATTPTER
jgi:hypothetical protein